MLLRNRLRAIAAIAVILSASAFTLAETRYEHKDTRLLLFIALDQARYDYLVRFRPAFTGGLKAILDQGVAFSDAHHDHAKTATAAGHTTLVTGSYPGHSGIIANEWFDRDSRKQMYSFRDSSQPLLTPHSATGGSSSSSTSSSSGRSPKNLLRTTLGDWLKETSPQSKVFSMSGKDRVAIPMGGKSADAAYWYDGTTGQFITSRYYMRKYPSYMKELHERKIADSYFGKAWKPLSVEAGMYQKMGIQPLDRGVYQWDLPHPLGGASFTPSTGFYSAFYRSPYMDAYLIELARTIVAHESLGKDSHLDILALGFSVLDLVGHDYGPNSPEVLDVLLRLDRNLGDFLEELDEAIGMEHIAIALGGDHGVMIIPEVLQATGVEAKRFATDDVVCYQQAESKLDDRFGEEDWLMRDLYLDYEAIGKRNLRRRDVEDALAEILSQCPSVKKVWTRTELESPTSSSDPFRDMYLHSFHPERSADLFVQLEKYHLNRLFEGTSHGSPYDYDSHVPMMILVPGVEARGISQRVQTVDLAPTIAALLGIPTPDDLDGVDRSELMENRGNTTPTN